MEFLWKEKQHDQLIFTTPSTKSTTRLRKPYLETEGVSLCNPKRNVKVILLLGLILCGFGTSVSGCPAPPPSPLNSRLVDGKIICDESFGLFGDSQPECGKNGEWKLPTCAKPIRSYMTLEKSCASVQRESNPFFRLDLQNPVPVNFVKLEFGGGTTNLDIEIRAGNNSAAAGKNPICKWETGPMNDTVQCSRPISAQYIYIQMVGEGLLQVCDVQVYSTHDPSRCKPSVVAGEIIGINSNCYELVTNGQSYTSASAQCTSRNGHLLSSNYPSTILKDKLEQLKAIRQLFWIGVERDKGFTARTWRWTKTGEVVKKPPWGKDQPNNYNREQNCVVLDGQRDWNWNDVGCNLDMIGFICEFRATTCPTPDRRELSSFEQQTEYKIGYQIEYKCPEGHFVQGKKFRECRADSTWSGIAPTCNYVNCGEFPKEIENGVVNAPDRTDYGAVIKYSCHEQHTLVGVNERSCKEDGKWSGSPPQCLISTCPTPPPLKNGTVSTSGLTPNSIAEYSCNSGSILIGSTSSKCILGGTWEPSPPSCQYIECESPPTITNGRIEAKNGLQLNSEAHVHCNEGFWVEGDDTLVCGIDSKWKGSGACTQIMCQEPAVPSGAFITGYDFSLHSEINYHCEDGHLLVGPSTRKCQNNGEWSGLAPFCRYIDCGRAPTIIFGQLSYQSTHLGSSIKYSCASNYKLNGDTIRVCTESGTWSGVSPKCEEIRCPEPQLPPNSIISVTLNDRSSTRSLITSTTTSSQTFKLGSVIRHRCERGYKLVGEGVRTCIEGEWTPTSLPSCNFVDCGEPKPIRHGRYDLSTNTTYLTSGASYECDPGWKLIGKSRVVCTEDGKWNGEASCKEITCEKLESENVLITKFRPGGIASYTCPRGSELIGNSTRVCMETGEWSGAEPKCRAMACPAPPPTPNARIFPLNTTLSHNAQVEYHCVPGFTRLGSPILTCFEGIWTPSDPPSCVLQEKQSTLPVVLGSTFGILLILFVVLGFLYLRHTSRSKSSPNNNNSSGSSSDVMRNNKDTPMVMFEPHYYDNPTPEHIYEDLNERNSVVTINGVAVS